MQVVLISVADVANKARSTYIVAGLGRFSNDTKRSIYEKAKLNTRDTQTDPCDLTHYI